MQRIVTSTCSSCVGVLSSSFSLLTVGTCKTFMVNDCVILPWTIKLVWNDHRLTKFVKNEARHTKGAQDRLWLNAENKFGFFFSCILVTAYTLEWSMISNRLSPTANHFYSFNWWLVFELRINLQNKSITPANHDHRKLPSIPIVAKRNWILFEKLKENRDKRTPFDIVKRHH